MATDLTAENVDDSCDPGGQVSAHSAGNGFRGLDCRGHVPAELQRKERPGGQGWAGWKGPWQQDVMETHGPGCVL